MSEKKPWLTPPRHRIQEVMVVKKLTDPNRPIKFAELNLDGTIVRYAVTTPQCRWRVHTLFTKEPGTIDWIESFQPGEVLVDVGANIGMYSIYAAVVSGAQVYAFEPESQNYAELCRNIFLNEAHHDILAYCAAISDRPVEVSRLLLSALMVGDSFHDFGEPSRPYAAERRFPQGSIGFSLDHLVESGAIPAPDHVKIDVDGHEHKAIGGMRALLGRGAIRTLLLECDASLPATRGMVESILGHGYRLNPDQLRLSREGLRSAAAVMDDVKNGAFTGNMIFARRAEDLAFATRALGRFSASDLDQMSLPA